MDTLTRRELFRRVGRAAVIGPVLLAARDQQAGLILTLSRLFGPQSLIGRWLRDLYWGW